MLPAPASSLDSNQLISNTFQKPYMLIVQFLYTEEVDMRHHSCDIPKVFSYVTIDTEQQ